MQITVEIVQTPLEPLASRPANNGSSGACVEFWGTVRDKENGIKISALCYEAYESMAKREMERILSELGKTFRCESAFVRHRIGWIGVSEAALHVRVQSPHRSEALELLTSFMNVLKQDVPIWKVGTKP